MEERGERRGNGQKYEKKKGRDNQRKKEVIYLQTPGRYSGLVMLGFPQVGRWAGRCRGRRMGRGWRPFPPRLFSTFGGGGQPGRLFIFHLFF